LWVTFESVLVVEPAVDFTVPPAPPGRWPVTVVTVFTAVLSAEPAVLVTLCTVPVTTPGVEELGTHADPTHVWGDGVGVPGPDEPEPDGDPPPGAEEPPDPPAPDPTLPCWPTRPPVVAPPCARPPIRTAAAA
jgi:hypothetical protein